MSKDKKKKGERAEAGKDAKIVRLEEQLAQERRETAETLGLLTEMTAMRDQARQTLEEESIKLFNALEENARLKAAVQNLTVQPAVTEPAPEAPSVAE